VLLPLRPIKYWTCSTSNANLCYAATAAGLDRTADKGLSWAPVHVAAPQLAGDSRGSFLDVTTQPPTVYHATADSIFSWPDGQVDKIIQVQQLLLSLSAVQKAVTAAASKRIVHVECMVSLCQEYSCVWSAPCQTALRVFLQVIVHHWCCTALWLQVVSGPITWFDAGRDVDGFTMAYTDADRDFCAQVSFQQAAAYSGRTMQASSVLSPVSHSKPCMEESMCRPVFEPSAVL
jgi:hypothetical protein